MSIDSLKLCLLVPFVLVSGDAFAQVCNSHITYADSIRTGDANLSRRTCNKHFIRTVWRSHRMSKKSWDGGFGWHRACDPRTPLSRTFNAMYLLYYSWDPANPQFWAPKRVPILQAGGYWSATRNKTLVAQCGKNPRIIAEHFRSGFLERTHLYANFFFHTPPWSTRFVGGGVLDNPIARASILIHEATHNLKPHNAGNQCRAEGSCDSHWFYYGANTYQAAWLLQFREKSMIANTHARDWAGNLANLVLKQFFTNMTDGRIWVIRRHHWNM